MARKANKNTAHLTRARVDQIVDQIGKGYAGERLTSWIMAEFELKERQAQYLSSAAWARLRKDRKDADSDVRDELCAIWRHVIREAAADRNWAQVNRAAALLAKVEGVLDAELHDHTVTVDHQVQVEAKVEHEHRHLVAVMDLTPRERMIELEKLEERRAARLEGAS